MSWRFWVSTSTRWTRRTASRSRPSSGRRFGRSRFSRRSSRAACRSGLRTGWERFTEQALGAARPVQPETRAAGAATPRGLVRRAARRAGRIMLPPPLIEHGGLSKEVVRDREPRHARGLGPQALARGGGTDRRGGRRAARGACPGREPVTLLLDMTPVHVPVLAGELIELLDPAARARSRSTAPSARAATPGWSPTDRRRRRAGLHRPRPAGRGAFAELRGRGALRDPLHPRQLRRRAAGAARRGRCARTCSTWTSGISSMQVDTRERGFSYSYDAPLDMRMDPAQALDARTVVNEWPEQRLAAIFREYGEERYARPIAREIVRRRERAPLETTTDLVDAIKRAVPMPAQFGAGHPAQARLPGDPDRRQRRDRVARARAAEAWGLLRRAGGWPRSRSTRSRTGASSASSPTVRAGCICPPDSRSASAAMSRRPSCSTRRAVRPERRGDRRQPARPLGQAARRVEASRGGAARRQASGRGPAAPPARRASARRPREAPPSDRAAAARPPARLRSRRAGARRAARQAAAPRCRRCARFRCSAHSRCARGRSLQDSSLLDRLLRGRTWIGLLGVLLIGLVALNVVAAEAERGGRARTPRSRRSFASRTPTCAEGSPARLGRPHPGRRRAHRSRDARAQTTSTT